MIGPIAATLAAAAFLAAVPACASAAYRTFRSPTGKLGCAFYSDAETPPAVRCEWSGGGDRAITLGETGRAKRVHVTDTVMDKGARTLAYGKTTTFRRLRCTSRASEIGRASCRERVCLYV